MKQDVGARTDVWVPGSSSGWVQVTTEININGKKRGIKIYSLLCAMEIQRD